MLAGAEGAPSYMDNFIVGRVDERNHNKNLFDVLQCIQNYKFRGGRKILISWPCGGQQWHLSGSRKSRIEKRLNPERSDP